MISAWALRLIEKQTSSTRFRIRLPVLISWLDIRYATHYSLDVITRELGKYSLSCYFDSHWTPNIAGSEPNLVKIIQHSLIWNKTRIMLFSGSFVGVTRKTKLKIMLPQISLDIESHAENWVTRTNRYVLKRQMCAGVRVLICVCVFVCVR